MLRKVSLSAFDISIGKSMREVCCGATLKSSMKPLKMVSPSDIIAYFKPTLERSRKKNSLCTSTETFLSPAA